jgi:hypothetical protein
MAKKDEAKDADAEGRQKQLDLISRGEGLEGGWCLDFDHQDVVYRCSEEEEAMARGEISISFNRDKVLDLKTGELMEREPDFRRPQGVPGMVEISGDVLATNADRVTSNTGGTSSGGGVAGGNA